MTTPGAVVSLAYCCDCAWDLPATRARTRAEQLDDILDTTPQVKGHAINHDHVVRLAMSWGDQPAAVWRFAADGTIIRTEATA